MTWKRELYPDNWGEIAEDVKARAGWRCQDCGRACRRPGQAQDAHKPVLTVHHIDGKPANSDDRANLIALCARCHLRWDVQRHARHAKATRERAKRSALDVPLWSEP